MVRLGITGGIGSGKSYVCRMLEQEFDVPVYNCDINARIITYTDYEVMQQLTGLLPGLYDKDGELDKSMLAHYLFASEENAAKVNAIVHPAVKRDFRKWVELRSDRKLLVVESAILYESHFDTEVDSVLFVDAPLEVRIQRVQERDGLSEEEIRRRIALQQTEQARGLADFCLVNDGQTDIRSQLNEILKSLNH
ncbi:MAG: dephospho-CoA kinase [Bacteroidaceae bacterium]|nr:dephospho-CoA kinase [Bacteroidaceae bacterium]